MIATRAHSAIETWDQYTALAQRTAPEHMDRTTRQHVARAGLYGEAGEVNELVKKLLGHGHTWDETASKIRAEIGDLFWYVAEMIAVFDVPAMQIGNLVEFEREILDDDPAVMEVPAVPDTVPGRIWYVVSELRGAAADADRWAYYSEGTQTQASRTRQMSTRRHLTRVVTFAIHLLKLFDLTLVDVLQANIDKLRERYPEGFSEAASRERIEVPA